MKITKSKEEIDRLAANRKKANEGCNVCPGCGEDKPWRLTKKGNIKGIVTGRPRYWEQGFFKPKHIKVDRYHCATCGCDWESEPYEYK